MPTKIYTSTRSNKHFSFSLDVVITLIKTRLKPYNEGKFKASNMFDLWVYDRCVIISNYLFTWIPWK